MQKYKQLLASRLLKAPNPNNYYEIVERTTALLSVDQKVKWASKCARSVLYIFEKTHPEDLRVRECLDFLDSIDWGKPTDKQIKSLRRVSKAAYAAAYAAAADAAYATAAYAADDAAATYTSARADACAARSAGYVADAATTAADAAIDATNATHTSARADARIAHKAQGAAYATACATSGTKKKQYKKNLQFLLEILINGK